MGYFCGCLGSPSRKEENALPKMDENAARDKGTLYVSYEEDTALNRSSSAFVLYDMPQLRPSGDSTASTISFVSNFQGLKPSGPGEECLDSHHETEAAGTSDRPRERSCDQTASRDGTFTAMTTTRTTWDDLPSEFENATRQRPSDAAAAESRGRNAPPQPRFSTDSKTRGSIASVQSLKQNALQDPVHDGSNRTDGGGSARISASWTFAHDRDTDNNNTRAHECCGSASPHTCGSNSEAPQSAELQSGSSNSSPDCQDRSAGARCASDAAPPTPVANLHLNATPRARQTSMSPAPAARAGNANSQKPSSFRRTTSISRAASADQSSKQPLRADSGARDSVAAARRTSKLQAAGSRSWR